MMFFILVLPIIGTFSSAEALITENKANEMIEKAKKEIIETTVQNLQSKVDEINSKYQDEKNILQSELATAQNEQKASADTLKESQENVQRLQKEIEIKEKTISDDNQKILELQSKIDNMNNIKNQLEQKSTELNNLSINSTEEINRLKNEMEQKVKDLEAQKQTIQMQSQQQISEITTKSNDNISNLRNEFTQKIKELEAQSQIKDDTIKAHEQTINFQNLKIGELLENKNTLASNIGVSSNYETLLLLDCALFFSRDKSTLVNSQQGNVVSNLSNADCYKTSNRALEELLAMQSDSLEKSTENIIMNSDFYKTSNRALNELLLKQQKIPDGQTTSWKKLTPTATSEQQ